jgi:hypothetical protein
VEEIVEQQNLDDIIPKAAVRAVEQLGIGGNRSLGDDPPDRRGDGEDDEQRDGEPDRAEGAQRPVEETPLADLLPQPWSGSLLLDLDRLGLRFRDPPTALLAELALRGDLGPAVGAGYLLYLHYGSYSP